MEQARKPIIGLTCHAHHERVLRSAVPQSYIDAVAAAGGAPLLVPMNLDEAVLRTIYETLDGLLLPGGDDVAPERYGHERHEKLGRIDANRDELEITMARWALRDDLPILGICRGIQVLAVAAGGTLYQDLPSQIDSSLVHMQEDVRDVLSHGVEIVEGSILAVSTGSTAYGVNSFHHQAVLDVPDGFSVTARADDGVIEAIEAPEHRFVVGVQCHPEGMWRTTAPQFAGLFRAFVRAAADSASRPAFAAN